MPTPAQNVVAPDNGSLTDTQVQEIYRELIKIAGSKNLDDLNLHEVVKAAKDPANPLHRYFTWDVQKAAQQHWLEQARRLIRSVRVEITTIEGLEARVREVVSIQVTDQNTDKVYHGYLPRDRVMKKKETEAQYVAKALEELKRWCLRHGDVKKLNVHRSTILGLPGVM